MKKKKQAEYRRAEWKEYNHYKIKLINLFEKQDIIQIEVEMTMISYNM